MAAACLPPGFTVWAGEVALQTLATEERWRVAERRVMPCDLLRRQTELLEQAEAFSPGHVTDPNPGRFLLYALCSAHA